MNCVVWNTVVFINQWQRVFIYTKSSRYIFIHHAIREGNCLSFSQSFLQILFLQKVKGKKTTLTCSSRDLASSETDSGMLRAVCRPIPAGWHRSRDCVLGREWWKEERQISINLKQREPDTPRAEGTDIMTPAEPRSMWEHQDWTNRRRPKSQSTWNNTDHTNYKQGHDFTTVALSWNCFVC